MRFEEFTDEPILEARMVWRRMGNKIKRAVRCTAGPRAGRVVSNASQCTKPIDLKKRMTLRRTKAKLGKRMIRKARRTKRFNPTAKRLRTLNKPMRRK
jgi:hypothetical protein